MVIVTTSNYVAKISRTLQRFIICEKCGCEYTFITSATGVGESSAELDAKAAAVTEAHNAIALAAAPCPDCGWYQQSMLKGLRRSHLGWARSSGLALLAMAGGLIILIGLTTDYSRNANPNEVSVGWAVAGVVATVGVVLFLIHAFLASRYHPNAIWPQRPTSRRREPHAVRTLEYQRRLEASPPQAWYVFKDQRKIGPVSREQLIAELQAGNVLLTDHVWTEGMDGWRVAEKGFAVPTE